MCNRFKRRLQLLQAGLTRSKPLPAYEGMTEKDEKGREI